MRRRSRRPGCAIVAVTLTLACTDRPDDAGGSAGWAPELALLADDAVALSVALVDFDVEGTGRVSEDGAEFAGEVHYESAIEGGEACDAAISLLGTAYTGDCRDCDLVFDIEAAVDESPPPADCELDPIYTYLASERYTDLQWIYWSNYEVYGYDYYTHEYETIAYEVLATGYTYHWEYDGGEYTWSDFWPIVYVGEGLGRGSLSWSDSDVSWSVSGVTVAVDIDYAYWGYDCGDPYYPDYYGAAPTPADFDGATATEQLDCLDYYDFDYDAVVDAWAFDATAGDRLSVTVDTVAADSAFDPFLWINGPDACQVAVADDQFDCTFPPSSNACPSLQMDLDQTGTYQVIVYSLGACTGTTAEYELEVGLE